jgi:hypothetical protein
VRNVRFKTEDQGTSKVVEKLGEISEKLDRIIELLEAKPKGK